MSLEKLFLCYPTTKSHVKIRVTPRSGELKIRGRYRYNINARLVSQIVTKVVHKGFNRGTMNSSNFRNKASNRGTKVATVWFRMRDKFVYGPTIRGSGPVSWPFP